MTYQPAVYRQQGGDLLQVASSGTINVDDGGTVSFDSGATLSLASGAVFYESIQSLAAADVATSIKANGFTEVVGTTTGPTYTLAAPTVAGQAKDIAMSASSSGATHRAVIYAGSTGMTYGQVAGDRGNTLTLATSTCHGVRLRAASTTAWRIIGFYPVVPALSNKTT